MNEVKRSNKNQIVIPRHARNALRLKTGDTLLVVVRGETPTVLPQPQKYSKAIRGMAHRPYSPDYLDKERARWS
jgi:AbrB family looped-hinge helix DNA binding protein